MENIRYILKYSIVTMMVWAVMGLQGCEEERWGNIPNLNEHAGAVTQIQVNPEKSFFNALNNLATEEVEFELNVDGFELTEVESVDIEVMFIEKDGTVDAEGNPADKTYDQIFLKTVSSFPSMVTVTGQEIIDAIGSEIAAEKGESEFTVDSLEVGDGFNLVFPINTADGRKLTTALSSDLCNEPVQPSFGGCNVQWFIACPSEIPAGTYTTLTSGTSTDPTIANPVISDLASEVTITASSPGVYTASDIYAGIYIAWYKDEYDVDTGDTKDFTDVCNNLTAAFNDVFGAPTTITGTYDPQTGVISLEGINDFGDTWTSVWTPK